MKKQFKPRNCGFIAALHIKRVAAILKTLAVVTGIGKTKIYLPSSVGWVKSMLSKKTTKSSLSI